jgi:hypothetical protein
MRVAPPRQALVADRGLREVQDATRAAVARELAVPPRPFGPVARLIRTSDQVHAGEITPVDPTDAAAGVELTLPRTTAELLGQHVMVVNVSDSTNDIVLIAAEGSQIRDEGGAAAETLTTSTAGSVTLLLCVDPEYWQVVL